MKDLLRYPLAMEGVYAPGGPAQAESQLYCGPPLLFLSIFNIPMAIAFKLFILEKSLLSKSVLEFDERF